MASSQSAKSSKFFRPTATGAFDQYLLEIQKLPMIGDPEEEKRLARRAQKGDPKAAERLVTANLRFVISYVKKYQGHGLDLSELVAIGNEGLLKAVRKFDPEHGVKFISYAVWWVRQAVLKALAEQTRSVRIPLNQNSALIKMSKAESLPVAGAGARADRRRDRHGAQRHGREHPGGAADDHRPRCRSTPRWSAPIEIPEACGERVAGTVSNEIEDQTDARLTREFIDRLFERYLTPRERRILYLYYGLEEGSEALTLERIGELLGVTRERIRQIRERAFEKLRQSPDVKGLKGSWIAA